MHCPTISVFSPRPYNRPFAARSLLPSKVFRRPPFTMVEHTEYYSQGPQMTKGGYKVLHKPS